MCGIFGLLSSASDDEVAQRLAAMQLALEHRGPDGSGRRIDPASGDRLVGLGHVRLSIIAPDSSSAKQPMVDVSGRFVMSFNGEIYNYLELRSELEAHGHRFAAASDSAVLLSAFAQWGVSCLTRLRGMFAVAIWDRQNRRLFLARDPAGKKPLWLRRVGPDLAFASEIQALTAPMGRPISLGSDVSPSAVADYLVFKYVPRNRSLVRDIQELPPGTWVEVDGADPHTEFEPVHWYQPPARRRPVHRSMTRTDIDAFRAAFDDAVAIRLRSDVPLGVFLSGGLDSSSVLAMAAQHRDTPFETFCVVFDGNEEHYSEAWAADLVAKRLNTRHRVLRLTAEHFASAIEAATWHRGAPLGEIADVALLELSRMARQSVKTVLSGEGADELLAGYPRYWGEMWVRRWQALVPPGADVIPAWIARSLPYAARRAAIMARAASERDFAFRQAGWFGAFSPGDLTKLAPDLVCNGLPYRVSMSGGRDAAIMDAMNFDKAEWLPANILARGDRLTMAAGLEMRMPFMDTDLAEQVAILPENAFLQGRTGKMILRHAMVDLLPTEITSRKKYGFRVPFHEWCRGSLRPILEERLLDPNTAIQAFLPRSGLERILNEHLRRQRNHEKALWALLGLEIHLQQLANPRPSAPAPALVG